MTEILCGTILNSGIDKGDNRDISLGSTKATKQKVEKLLVIDPDFEDLYRILTVYGLKKVARNCSNHYHDDKENIDYERKETTPEHVYSCLKLADFFLFLEEEFADLDRLRVYELLLYHDDIEIKTKDTCISKEAERINKNERELRAVPILAAKYPEKLRERFIALDKEHREAQTKEGKFSQAVDKMDALIHELEYPQDWAAKGFDEINVRKWFQPSFEYSPTFMKYFELIIQFLRTNGHFDT